MNGEMKSVEIHLKIIASPYSTVQTFEETGGTKKDDRKVGSQLAANPRYTFVKYTTPDSVCFVV